MSGITSNSKSSSSVANPDKYDIAPPAKVKLTPAEEIKFQNEMKSSDWYKEYKNNYGEAPNLDSKDYNYRAAWKSGAKPERYAPDENRLHWPSETSKGESLKAINHPTGWMEDYMQLTGKDPSEPTSLSDKQAAAMKRVLIKRYGKK
mgnify:CR=1 FL=1